MTTDRTEEVEVDAEVESGAESGTDTGAHTDAGSRDGSAAGDGSAGNGHAPAGGAADDAPAGDGADGHAADGRTDGSDPAAAEGSPAARSDPVDLGPAATATRVRPAGVLTDVAPGADGGAGDGGPDATDRDGGTDGGGAGASGTADPSGADTGTGAGSTVDATPDGADTGAGTDAADAGTAGATTADADPADADAADGDAAADEASDEASADRSSVAARVAEESVRETGRWAGALGAALLAGGIGVVAQSTVAFVAAAIPFLFVAYSAVTSPPSPAVSVTRSFSDRSPGPGSTVWVRIEVENVGSDPVPDLRVADDPPDDLRVLAGSPTACVSLGAGETATVEYALRAARGVHEFGDTRLVVRDLSGSGERRRRMDNADTLTVRDGVEELPLEGMTIPFSGQVPTTKGGEGLDFHSTRQYHHSDPMSRIDWNRYASTNELRTINYRETEAATVVFVVDDRSACEVRRRSGEPDGVELARHAADLLADVSIAENNRVAAALVGEGVYLRPGGGNAQALRVHALMTEGPPTLDDEGGHVARTYGGFGVDRLLDRLPENAQVVYCTALPDDAPVDFAETLAAHGHAVTVVSPDLTTTDTAGGTVARIDRRQRVSKLRGDRIRVVEWSPDESLQTAVDRARRRWSR